MTQNVSSQTPNNLAAFCWSIADLLRRDFKQSQYGRIILPFTLLRRLEGVLKSTKEQVLTELDRIQTMNLPEEAQEMILLRATDGLSFFNTSKIDLSLLCESDIKTNLQSYIQSFSKDAREIFEYFNFAEFIDQLNDAKLLYKVFLHVRQIDLSPKVIANHDMGLAFEELIRRFSESSSETAGEHFTPRDVVDLTTTLVFRGREDLIDKANFVRSVYDPTAGSGGFLSAAIEYFRQSSTTHMIQSFGQEINTEAYAICKSLMLIRGQNFKNIKLGNTLSDDKFCEEKFDYMFSNAPFGANWTKVRESIKDENSLKGFEGRFGPGLPRISDGSLLFLMHLVSKIKNNKNGGSRIGIILNGSPLFTGGAGSGESEIRRYIFENDLLEGIIALPNDMFYNTGIATYIWVLSNNKTVEQKSLVKLVNASNIFSKMRKPIGSKRNLLSHENIKNISDNYISFEDVGEDENASSTSTSTSKGFFSKTYKNEEFSYRRVIVERPLKLSVMMSDERLETLRFNSLYSVEMQWIYEEFTENWDSNSYGYFDEKKDDVLVRIRAKFPEIKSFKLKKIIDSDIWKNQKILLDKAYAIQKLIGKRGGGKVFPTHDYNSFVEHLETVLTENDIILEGKDKRTFLEAITWKNPDAKPVVKRYLKQKENPFSGAFLYKGSVVEFESDSELREVEQVPMCRKDSVVNFYEKEVKPYYDNAWIDCSKVDAQDGLIGTVGYEISIDKFLPTSKENQTGIELRRLDVTVVSQDETWDILVDRIRGKAFIRKQSENVTGKRLNTHNYSFLKVPVDINIDYLAFELNKKLEAVLFRGTGIQRRISLDKVNRIKFNLPVLTMQDDFIENRTFLNRLISDKRNLLKRYDLHSKLSNNLKLEKFKDSLDETQFIINKAPYFLSELLYRSTNIEGKDRFEVLLKFLECLSIYYCAVLYSSYEGDSPPKALSPIRKEYATFSRWNSLLEEITKTDSGISKTAKQLLPRLEEANTIRNTSIGHGAIPTKKQIVEDLQAVESIVSSVNEILLEAFDNYKLIYPLKNRWDGEFYSYEVITFSGLCGYPFSNDKVKVREPFIDGGLYLISSNSEHVYPIQNFIKLSDISKDSQIDGFYFYSKNDKETGQNEYICHQQVPIQTKLINEQFQ